PALAVVVAETSGRSSRPEHQIMTRTRGSSAPGYFRQRRSPQLQPALLLSASTVLILCITMVVGLDFLQLRTARADLSGLDLQRLTTTNADLSGLAVRGNQLLAGEAPITLHGVNRSGTEYACIQGWGIEDGPMDQMSVNAIATWGANLVRVPLNEDCWLGI